MRKVILSLLVALSIALTATAQDRIITGKVTDEKNLPAEGISVTTPNGKYGTKTDAMGIFSLKLPTSEKSVTFSGVDFQTLTKTVGSDAVINVQLAEKDNKLDEIVVVAYGTVKKQEFAGSASTIAGKEIEDRHFTNVANVLTGAAPGIQTAGGSGQPGSAPSVRIRGIGSINASSEALYVVDGVIFTGSIANLSGTDIEDITILKDAASTSLYGSRAANGVVLIRTKKGKAGSKPKFTFSQNTGFSTRAIPEYELAGVNDYYPLFWQGIRNNAVYRTNSPLTPAAAAIFATNNVGSTTTGLAYNPYNVPSNAIVLTDGKLNPNATLVYRPEDLDWENSISRKGVRNELNMSVSGGRDKTDYFFSLGYLSDKAYLIESDYKRYNTRLNINTQATSWFKTGINLSGTFTNSNQAQTGTSTANVNPINFTRNIGAIYPIYAYDPAKPGQYLLDANGQRQFDFGNLSALGLANRPGALGGRHITAETQLNKNFFNRNFWGARTYGEIAFAKWLRFTTNVSVDVTNFSDLSYGNPIVGDAAPAGRINKSTSTTTNYVINQLINFDKKFGSHSVEALLGHENNDRKDDDFSASRTVQIATGNFEFTNFSLAGASTSSQDNLNYESYFSRVGYNFKSKYFLTGSLRTDGSSRFARDKRWGTFGAVSAAWRIDQEAFLANSKVVSALKLRSSYGTVGNDQGIGFYAYQPLFGVGGQNNNANEAGALQSTLGNLDLQWEVNRSFDVGVDFGLFKNRVTGTVEYFNRESSNLLFDVPLPVSSGVGSQTRNIGTMFNQGFEFDLTADVIRVQDFVWNINVNATTYKNEITKLPPGQNEIITGTKKLQVGRSIFDYWLREYVGVDPTDGEPLYRAQNTTAATNLRINGKGDTLTTDINNGKFHYNGSTIAKVFGGIRNSFSYKGFRLSLLVNYQIGGKAYDNLYQALMHSATQVGSSIHKDALNAWKQPGDVTNVPRLDNGKAGLYNGASDRWLVDASFISFRNVSASYSLPQSAASKLKLSGVTFTVTGENLGVITKRQGLNPEQSFTGVGANSFVPARFISGGVSVTF